MPFEFPEDKDSDELEEFDNQSYVYEEDSLASSPAKFPWLKVFAIVVGVALIASLLIPLFGPLMNGFKGDPESDNEDTILRNEHLYSRWITDNVNEILGNTETANKARLLGVKFDQSINNPIIGILMNYGGSEGTLTERMLKGTSAKIFHTLFDDKRGQNIVIVWLKPGKINSEGQTIADVVLMIGMLRQTEKAIDWKKFDTNKLDDVTDLYKFNSPF